MSYIRKAIPAPPWHGLPLPMGFSPSWEVLFDTFKRQAEGFKRTLSPLDDPKIVPDAIYLTYKSISVAAVSVMMKQPLLISRWADLLQQRASTQGKFDKMDVVYLDINPPPVFWDYKCIKCRFWRGGPGVMGEVHGTCTVVAGTIFAQGWCAIWLPSDNYRALSWPKEFIQGNW